jgi:hypothetical protein
VPILILGLERAITDNVAICALPHFSMTRAVGNKNKNIFLVYSYQVREFSLFKHYLIMFCVFNKKWRTISNKIIFFSLFYLITINDNDNDDDGDRKEGERTRWIEISREQFLHNLTLCCLTTATQDVSHWRCKLSLIDANFTL